MYFNTKHEKIVYNNRMSSHLPLQIFLAGISYPWKDYVIPHNTDASNYWDKYILEYILEGKGYVETDRERHILRGGDYYFMNRNRWQIYGADRTEPYKKMFVVFHGSLADSLVEQYRITDSVVIRHTDMEPVFRQLLGILEHSTYETHTEDMDEAVLLLHRMLLPLRSPAIVQELEKPGDMAEKIRGYIDDNILIRPIHLETLSEYFCLSQSQIIRIFRKAYAQTPGQYILQKRLEAADYLLTMTRMSVSEIAANLYFSDNCYFSMVFRKWKGMSPTQRRKQLL